MSGALDDGTLDAPRYSVDDRDDPSDDRGVDEAKGADNVEEHKAGEGGEGAEEDDPEALEEPGAREAFKDAAGNPIDLACQPDLFYPAAMDPIMAILNKVR